MEFFRNSLVSILTVLGLASLVLFILFFSGHSLADEYSDNMNDGKSWAEANKERVNESGKSSTEADSATPVNPTMTSDDTEEFYNRSRADLPSYNVDRENDPLFKRQESVSLLGTSLAQSYSGCVQLPSGSGSEINTVIETCQTNGSMIDRDYSCTRTNVAYCSNYSDIEEYDPSMTLEEANVSINAGFTRLSANSFQRSETTVTVPEEIVLEEDELGLTRWNLCEAITYNYSIDIPDIELITEFEAQVSSTKGFVVLNVNGTQVDTGGNIGSDCARTVWRDFEFGEVRTTYETTTPYNGTTDILSNLQAGNNTVQITYTRRSYSDVTLTLTGAAREPCVEEDYLPLECPSDITDQILDRSILIDSTCIQGSSYINDEGFRIYRNCWQWREDYRLRTGPFYEEDSACAQLEAQGCGRIGTECISMNGAFCETYELTFQCQDTPGGEVALCGEQLICPDGDCATEYQVVPDTQEDFKESATWIEMMNQMGEENSGDGLTIFTADDKKCKKRSLGFSDCCQDDGWGVDLGVAKCSTTEKELGEAKQNGLTHYIGSYKSGPWYNRKRYQVYCVYNSKLSRIFMEQANVQLGLEYGTPRSPECNGLTMDQMANLDMDQIDLSEYFPDAEANAAYATDPNVLETQEDAETAVCNMGAEC